MDLLKMFSEFIVNSADQIWNGPVLVTLLLGGGIYLLFRSKTQS